MASQGTTTFAIPPLPFHVRGRNGSTVSYVETVVEAVFEAARIEIEMMLTGDEVAFAVDNQEDVDARQCRISASEGIRQYNDDLESFITWYNSEFLSRPEMLLH